MVPPRRGESIQVRRPLWKYVWNTSPKNTAASTPCGISPLRRRSAVLWEFKRPNVRMWQYDEVGQVWTGSKIDKFVKSSEIVDICRLAVDILQNFCYCDGVRKVIPTLGKQVIPDGLMCSAMYPSPSACRQVLSPPGFMVLCMEPVAKAILMSILSPQQIG